MKNLAKLMLVVSVIGIMGGVVAKAMTGNVTPLSTQGWWKVVNTTLLVSIASGIVALLDRK